MFQNKLSGGKGNRDMFIDRDGKICAAGKPTDQPEESVNALLKYYNLQDKVEALISDSIMTPISMTKLPPLKQSKVRDMRHASIFSEGSELINPPAKTKMHILAEDFKSSSYSSYWKKEVGKFSDPVPTLPEGFNIYRTTCGLKTQTHENMYDIISTVTPITDKKPTLKSPGYQMSRNYCSFDKNSTFGVKSQADRTGKYMRYCLTDKRMILGTALKQPIIEMQKNFNEANLSKLAKPRTLNDISNYVPEGFAFGKLKPPCKLEECLRTCEVNKYKELIKQCLGHLNTVRKCLAKRFDGTFFYKFYLELKFLDKTNNGWLPKQVLYHQCKVRFIELHSSLIEPLLIVWKAFDEINNVIVYKTFVQVINYREPLPQLPKIRDIPREYLDYRTIYSDMISEKQATDNRIMAAISSGRYFDKDFPITPESCCMADRTYLPQESDAKTCLSPSIFTYCGVSHRDLYARRDPKTIKDVFERAGHKMDEEKFKTVWELAEKYHSQKWVCYETFRKGLREYEKSQMKRL